ncbi:transcriptional regulator, LacI family [Bifidobacterium bohemicum]|uniref:LacI family transcriptional regulator n=1 Tax=Bifidobacterium bohemicum DSM 22767 TaxID=1437606 RepID=A0A086ZDW9_9BIFI|nr:LacI family DNA-binding transcriptional regulator [Bifidobacterium bohemicum]KFI44719.1 LacI family transcriptional regulator [Bifidobacterium bohemicum DSM 22767]SCC18185.1 transcriptional regulator, LacI family [Bifidobacterium bohemicum]
MVTLKDVAEASGVSVSTASAVMRGLDIVKPDTTRKVRNAAKKLHYHANISARSLRSGRSNIFTLIVPDLENQYYAELSNCLSNELLAQHKQLIIQVSQYDKDKEIEQVRSLNASMSDGLFICSTNNSGADIKSVAGDYPVIMFDDMSAATEARYDSVETPSQAGMTAMIRHLCLEHDRKRVGIVGTLVEDPSNRISYTLRHNRCNFAHQALMECGYDRPNTFITCDWDHNSGIAIAHHLAEEGMPYDALCCMNDDLALGVMRGLAECGIVVPDQVAVTGYDGITSGSYTSPTLTTIAVDFKGMAQTATELMQQKILHKDASTRTSMPRRIIVGFQLLRRESTCRSRPEANR